MRKERAVLIDMNIFTIDTYDKKKKLFILL